jgi:hypothetical protein
MELAALAARTERANQPRHLVVMALLVLAGSLAYLGVAWSGYAGARKRLAAQQRLTGDVVESASRYRALVAAGAGAEGARGAETSDTILSTIQGVGERAGLKNRIGVPTSSRREPRANSAATSTQMKWTYTVKDPSLSALLNFAALAVGEVPGLEVYSAKVRPEAQGWELVVVFSRWERDAGKPEGT